MSAALRARAVEPWVWRNTKWDVRCSLPAGARHSRPKARTQDARKRCLGSVLAKHGTSVLLQMKDPDVLHPCSFSEDTTTCTSKKMHVRKKTEDPLRATKKLQSLADADSSVARRAECNTFPIKAYAGILPASYSTHDQPPPNTSTQHGELSTFPDTVTGKLWWTAGALLGTLEGLSKLFI